MCGLLATVSRRQIAWGHCLRHAIRKRSAYAAAHGLRTSWRRSHCRPTGDSADQSCDAEDPWRDAICSRAQVCQGLPMPHKTPSPSNALLLAAAMSTAPSTIHVSTVVPILMLGIQHLSMYFLVASSAYDLTRHVLLACAAYQLTTSLCRKYACARARVTATLAAFVLVGYPVMLAGLPTERGECFKSA
ncbi:hypothetical protein FA95DRAFT_121550 [Auriscalpium vulgare]|uniref:Uncharacterized protein n=1 Tax=Auriscalpium vulgare TaxID=40419 RepID=A0ACB8RNW9_9AGAM|nr:hypothetical protein FA95DRAFT_121550 [Auriscalpium vulgare]